MALLAALGCDSNRRDEAPEPKTWQGPPPVTAAEKQRGLAACADYQKKVCACAETRADLAGDCRMAGSRISALELSLRIAAAEKITEPAAGNAREDNDSSRALAISNARKVMRRCIEQVAELARGCP